MLEQWTRTEKLTSSSCKGRAKGRLRKKESEKERERDHREEEGGAKTKKGAGKTNLCQKRTKEHKK